MVVKRKMADKSAEHFIGQHLLFGVYLQTRTALYLLNMHYRGELKIDEGKHVLACFSTRNYFE